jgi:membrane-associated protein
VNISQIPGLLLALPPWLVLSAVGVLPALEASVLVGLVVPGETAVLAGGVAAHAGIVPLWAVVVVAVCGAAVGDQVGYSLGRRFGPQLLDRAPRRLGRDGAVGSTMRLMRRHGAFAVLLGRWAATLRAVVPGVAGASGVARGRFTVANVTGAALWATTVAYAGYAAGASYGVLAHRLGLGGELLAGVVVLLVVCLVLRARRRRRRQAANLATVDSGDDRDS